MLKVIDEYQQRLLNIRGYFTTPFLNIEQLKNIANIYHTNFDAKEEQFYFTSFHPNYNLKKKISEEILQIAHKNIAQYFTDYDILGCSFLYKSPNSNNPLPLHQDWTVCDEQNNGSYTLWIPLQDTNKENGTIRIIEFSHAIDDNFRAPSLPVSFENDRQRIEQLQKSLLLDAGEAFVFNQKLMHSSFSNSSNEGRLALTIGLVPKNTNLFMLYYNDGQIHQYDMPKDMFLRYPEIIEKPTIGTFNKSFDYKIKPLNYKTILYKIANQKRQLSMQPLFKDEKDQQQFEKNGFLKIPVLAQHDIQQLVNFLYESGIKKETDYGFYVGMDHENKTLVKKMMDTISEIALPKISPFLKDYQLTTASFVIKDVNKIGVVPPHQDWTFVEDEVQHCSVTCWIPLVDVDMQNGCIGVIKGSHKFFDSVRPSPSPQVPSPLAKHLFSIFPYFTLIPMQAGEALIFDNRTFHASPPNISNQPRLAIGLGFTQKDAKLVHYYLKPTTKDTLLKYKIDSSFFLKYDNGLLSKMYDAGKIIEDFELLEEVKFTWQDLSKKEMKQKVLAAGNVYNEVLTQQMKILFAEQMKSGILNKVKDVLNLPFYILRKIKSKF